MAPIDESPLPAASEGGAAGASPDPRTRPVKKVKNVSQEVAVAALDLLNKKREQAVKDHNYEQAGRIHEKMKQLEDQLGADYHSISTNPVLRKGLLKSGKGLDHEEEGKPLLPLEKGGIFSAANPFKTVRLLRSSGYSQTATFGLLFTIYAIVIVAEMALLRIGMTIFQIESISDMFTVGLAASNNTMAGGTSGVRVTAAADSGGHAILDDL
ncbi:unnamed protein product [Amoebophrya sp. A25]|nr:unnamed protein product [Amoebophrya sp. A25]|eukprot:GSA25T00005309001.1